MPLEVIKNYGVLSLPSGDYYFGDPCYLFSGQDDADELWSQLVEQFYEMKKVPDEDGLLCPATVSTLPALVYFDDVSWMYVADTADGDGVFRVSPLFVSSDIKDVGVDAGLLAIISKSLFEARAAKTPKDYYRPGQGLNTAYAKLTFKNAGCISLRGHNWYVGERLLCQTD